MSNQDVHPISKFLTLLVAWLVPGGGFLMHGRFWRGFVLLSMILITFLIGCRLHGGIIWPVWSMKSEGFNIINNISFLIQMGTGLPALISLFFGLYPDTAPVQWAIAENAHAMFDLGSFYVLVCGAMNYFVVCNTNDRLFHPKPSTEAVSK